MSWIMIFLRGLKLRLPGIDVREYKRALKGVKKDSGTRILRVLLAAAYFLPSVHWLINKADRMTILNWLRRLTTSTARSRIEPAAVWEDDVDIDPFNPFPDPITIEISDIFDLHTIPPRDVKRVVEEYLQQAHEAGFRSVRIIHGRGIGVQREMVRSVLARVTFVADWTDAPPEAGGLGATIARFHRKS